MAGDGGWLRQTLLTSISSRLAVGLRQERSPRSQLKCSVVGQTDPFTERRMIRLVAMTQAEFVAFTERTIATYAAEQRVACGWSPEEAICNSREELARLLPAGLETPDQYLYTLTDEASGEPVGSLWFGVQRRGETASAYLGELEIYPPHRRRGLGRAGMLAAERQARALGCTTMSLNVFAHNEAAQALYRGLGFEVAALRMAKAFT